MNSSAESRTVSSSAPESGNSPGDALTFAPLISSTRLDDVPEQSHELDRNPRFLVLRQFHSHFLPNDREIDVYLPEAYWSEPTRRFPVFYLHDGQNLFDGRTSYIPNHTWRAHTTADLLARSGQIEPVILVGVHNTGLHRMAEYTPTRDSQLRGGNGALYGRLLAEELKPLIDLSFRTLPDASHTALGGSSLGGLISLYIGLACSDVYSKLALLSPSLWWDNRSILRLLNQFHTQPQLRIWLDMGTAEGFSHLHDADLLYRRLLTCGWRDEADLRYLRVPGGQHNEDAWAARFDQVLRFLFPLPS